MLVGSTAIAASAAWRKRPEPPHEAEDEGGGGGGGAKRVKRLTAAEVRERDVVILRGVLQLKPHRVERGQVHAVWAQIVRNVLKECRQETSENNVACRLGVLMRRFVDEKLDDTELLELMSRIVEDRQRHERELRDSGVMPRTGIWWYAARGVDVATDVKAQADDSSALVASPTSCMYPSVAKLVSGSTSTPTSRSVQDTTRLLQTAKAAFEELAEKKATQAPQAKADTHRGAIRTRRCSDVSGPGPSHSVKDTHVSLEGDERRHTTATDMRAEIVGSTLSAVADRLAEMERLWARDAEHERQLNYQQMQERSMHHPADWTAERYAAQLQETVDRLSEMVRACIHEQMQLRDETGGLSAVSRMAEKERLLLQKQLKTLSVMVNSNQCELLSTLDKLDQMQQAHMASLARQGGFAQELMKLDEAVHALPAITRTVSRLETSIRYHDDVLKRGQHSPTTPEEPPQSSSDGAATRSLARVEAALEQERNARTHLEKFVMKEREHAVVRERELMTQFEAKLACVMESCQRSHERAIEKEREMAHATHNTLLQEIRRLRDELQREREERTKQHDALVADIKDVLTADD